MIKARENKIQSTDLLVCFPSRAHLTLTPKPICSPSRPSEPNKRPNHNRHLKRINTRPSGGSSGGPNSPLMWAKNNQIRQEVAEPTSPKVTCAGQIKVRPRSSAAACKSWQSVMEEIERIHNRTKDKKKSKWAESFGFKKDVMNFLTCLRNIRFDFRCFGGFPQPDIVSSDDEEEEDDDEFDDDEFEICEEDHPGNNIITDISNSNDNNANNAVFSKWFMVLQENNQGNKDITLVQKEDMEDSSPAVPPPNALLLMRCRSAPAKSWLEEKELEDKQEEIEQVKEDNNNDKKKRESLAILMKYDADFYKLSSEISQETWVVGGFKDPFSRSRSWRR
ncbi:hypothetical protein RDABS01_009778 [Bienertia sinuspersici]